MIPTLKVTALSILDEGFEPIMNKKLEEKYNELGSLVSLLKGLLNFGVEEFNSKITYLAFEDLNMNLLWDDDMTIIVSSVKHAQEEEKKLFTKYLNELNTELSILKNTVNSTNEKLDLAYKITQNYSLAFNKKMSIFDETKYDFTAEENLNIIMTLVCEPSALPITYNIYNNTKTDPILISGMLSSISTFSEVALQKRIKRISMENVHLFFQYTESKLYVTVLENKSPDWFLDSKIIKRVDNLLSIMSNTINILFDLGEKVKIDELSNIMDTLVMEALNNMVN